VRAPNEPWINHDDVTNVLVKFELRRAPMSVDQAFDNEFELVLEAMLIALNWTSTLDLY